MSVFMVNKSKIKELEENKKPYISTNVRKACSGQLLPSQPMCSLNDWM